MGLLGSPALTLKAIVCDRGGGGGRGANGCSDHVVLSPTFAGARPGLARSSLVAGHALIRLSPCPTLLYMLCN